MSDPYLKKLITWSGSLWISTFGLGWLICLWLPTFSPNLSANELADLYKENHLPWLLGGVIMSFSAIFVAPLGAAFTLLIEVIEKKFGPLSIIMVITMATGAMNICLSGIFWAAAAFRPERSPEALQAISDIGMLFFFGGISAFIGLFAALAYASLKMCDPEDPVIPRWYGYLCLWTTIILIPDLMVFFFKTGPFAWDGVVGLWVPLVLFVLVFNLTPSALKKSIEKHL